MSGTEERQRELDELKSLNASFKRNEAKMKADLIQEFNREVALSRRLARDDLLDAFRMSLQFWH